MASARRSRPTEQQRHRFRRERSTRSIMTASLRAYQATTGFPRPVVNRTGCVAGNRPVPVLSRHSQDIVIVTNCADPDVALGRSPANPAYRRCGQRASTDPPLCSGPALTQPHASRTSVANRSSRWPLSRESSCSSWSVGSDPLEIRTAAGPSSAVQWVSIGGPYTVWSHARHVHVVWPPACPRHAWWPTRTWFGRRKWPLGHRLGGWVIHFPLMVRFSSPSTPVA